MCIKSCILTISILCLAKAESKKTTLLTAVETFDTLKLLIGLKKYNDTSLCGQHVGEFLSDLSSAKYWASAMYDASAKFPSGLLRGNIKNFGDFDECIKVEHPEKKFVGQHCMLGIDLASSPKIGNKIFRLTPPNEDRNVIHRILKILYGVCVPSTCIAREISKGINSVLNDTVNGHVFSVNIKENCWTKEREKIGDTGWMAIGILIFFGLTAFLSTIYDLCQRSIAKNKPNSLLISFSLYTNSMNLFKISDNPEQFKALHGIRVLSTFWVVLCHSGLSVLLSGPTVNSFDSIKIVVDLDYTLILNAVIAVDTFFFMSGMLVTTVFFRDIRKKGYHDAPLGFIHRYLRLTPPYAAMILIAANIFIYIGTGPLWNSVNKRNVENCQKYWWTGILYIQNFINPTSNCVGQSWYLSVDMQLHWLSPIILYSVYFWPKYAVLLLGVATLSAVCTNFTIAYIYGLGASGFATNNPKLQTEADYIQFYTRASPYLIGMAMGYIICQIQVGKIKIKLKKYWIVIGWILSTGLCLYSLYGTLSFNKGKREPVGEPFYLALHRVSWSLGIGWIVLACMQGYAGPVNVLLSWDAFQPLSKLSYVLYLIHQHVINYRLGTLRTSQHAGDLDLIYSFLGDLILSCLLAIPFSLIFEIPFSNIDKYYLPNLKILPIPWKREINEKPEEVNTENAITLHKLEEYTK